MNPYHRAVSGNHLKAKIPCRQLLQVSSAKSWMESGARRQLVSESLINTHLRYGTVCGGRRGSLKGPRSLVWRP